MPSYVRCSLSVLKPEKIRNNVSSLLKTRSQLWEQLVGHTLETSQLMTFNSQEDVALNEKKHSETVNASVVYCGFFEVKIGSASCWERVCEYVLISVVAG